MKRIRLSLGVIVGLIILVRLGYVLLAGAPIDWSDAPTYDNPAWNVVQGVGYRFNPQDPVWAGREPGYALVLLAPLYSIFGHSLKAVIIVQILLSAFAFVPIWFLVRRFFSRQTASLSGVLYAFTPGLVIYTGEVLTETLFSALIIGAVYFFIRALEPSSERYHIILSAALFGLAALTRSMATAMPLWLLGWLILLGFGSRRVLAVSLAGLIGVAVLLAPWIYRNYQIYEAFLIREDANEMLWSGSDIASDGDWEGIPESIDARFGGQEPTIEQRVARERELGRLAFLKIKQDPSGVAWIWLKKPYKIFVKADGQTALLHLLTNRLGLPKTSFLEQGLRAGLYGYHWLVILLPFAAGVALTARRLNLAQAVFLGMVIYFILIYLPFNAVPRYAMPALPYAIPFSAMALVLVVKNFKNHLKDA